jgi:acylphosphatase
VSGWITSREDGAFEAVFGGEASAVHARIDWPRQGPPQARVITLEVIEEEPRGERGFSVR